MAMKLEVFMIKNKVNSNHTCLVVISLDFALKMTIIIRKWF